MRITCMGAGYVGGPTMAMIALKCPSFSVTVFDVDERRIAAWNSPDLPIYEPGLAEVVEQVRGKNLFFSSDPGAAITGADIIFVAVNTPTKMYGRGAGKSSDLTYYEKAARMIAEYAGPGDHVVVEKSTIPVGTSDILKTLLSSAGSPRGARFSILSNPEFLAEGTAIRDLMAPDRVLIGGDGDEPGRRAVALLTDVYASWVPRERIITTSLWSGELSKLAANALLAQRVSSINALSELCEATGADVGQVARAVGLDSRIGPMFLQASVGFGGSCFQKDLLSLIYLCHHHGLERAAAYWQGVLDINDHQKDRFVSKVVSTLFNTVRLKKIGVLGFAFKKDTSDTRETPAISVCASLIEEQALLCVYDPKVPEASIVSDLAGAISGGEAHARAALARHLTTAPSVLEAARGAHALVVLTEWDQFRAADYKAVFEVMSKPAHIFDGRRILDRAELERIGFKVFVIGS